MINLNANAASSMPRIDAGISKIGGADAGKSGFGDTVKAVEKYISSIEDNNQASEMSIKDLLSGKNTDITSVVSAMAKADMSFKLLVGVRNKLIEAYKQTMNMPI